MATFAARIQQVKPSQTKAMTQRARDLRAAGVDVIVLSQGEPDFDTPDHIRAAGIKAIDDGKTRYTPVAGVQELRQAVCRKFARDNGLQFKPDQITVGGGAKQVITNALLATVDPGETVLFPAPCWTSYPDMVGIAEGTPVAIDCTQTDFKLTPAALDRAITPTTRWLMLNSPSNPTGAVYSRQELAALADVVHSHPHLWVMSDDIYEHLVHDEETFATMAQVAPDLQDRILTVNGVSKAHAMTGWRIGYGAGPKDLIGKMNLLQSQTTSHACSIAQYAAIEALDGPEDHLAVFARAFRQRRDFVWDKLRQAPGLRCDRRPAGAFYLFVDCSDVIGAGTPDGSTLVSDSEFASYLLEEAHVAVVPGTAFLGENHIRISYASSLDDLGEACDRIIAACERLEFNTKQAASS